MDFNNLCTGNKPFVSKCWVECGIYTLKELYKDYGLKSIQILKDEFSLPGFFFFLYLRLRSALKAYGVPWLIKISPHPMVHWIDSSMASRGIVNIIYKSLVVRQYSNIPTEGFWERERLGYICNPRSLKEGTETSRRMTDRIGISPERPIHFECN